MILNLRPQMAARERAHRQTHVNALVRATPLAEKGLSWDWWTVGLWLVKGLTRISQGIGLRIYRVGQASRARLFPGGEVSFIVDCFTENAEPQL